MSESSSLLSVDSPLEQVIEPPAKPTPTVTPPASGFVPQFVSYQLPVPAFAPLQQTGAVTIIYEYDPLYRLTEANYSNGDYYHYTLRQAQGGAYDEVGNRLSQDTLLGGLPSTTTYLYDDANRLTSVNGVTYTWDANGNPSTSSVQACLTTV